MKSLVLTLCAVVMTLAILGSSSPSTARQISLEERVRNLEIQVAALNQRVGIGGGSSSGGTHDGIKRTYTGIGETWIIKQVPLRGTTLTLGNGTRWEVSAADGQVLTGWKINEIILIGTNSDRQFPYTLTNQTRKQKVVAQYLGQN